MTAAAEMQLLRIHIGEDDHYAGRPLHAEIVDRCRAAGVELAVVYRGIEGFGASTRIHRRGFWGRSQDAPIVVTILATAAQAATLQPQLSEIVDEGLIATSAAAETWFFGAGPAAC
jgi:PII-like signaling protein